MQKNFSLRILFILFIGIMVTSCDQPKEKYIWKMLPPIPDETGFAGSFAGLSNDVLIVAGGSNFPNGGTPWNGGKKTWYSSVYILEEPDADWKLAGHLPKPLGYGVSISTPQGLLCIGGSNEDGHHDRSFLLKYIDDSLVVTEFPSLPFPLANMTGAMVNNVIYIAGGLSSPESKSTSNYFLRFDLNKNDNWEELPSWPGASRMLSVCAAGNNEFYLFSGTSLKDGEREYLKDAYKFSETKGWEKIADLPVAVVAAASPAYSATDESIYVFGGDDGSKAKEAAELQSKHPGFSQKILKYNPRENAWNLFGTIKTDIRPDSEINPNGSIWSPVTTTMVRWNNKLVFPGGEVRPGTRTPNVLSVAGFD